jgi:hypothetical protein
VGRRLTGAPGTAAFLRQGAALLARHDPARWARVRAALGTRVTRLHVGGEVLTAWVGGEALHVRGGAVRRAQQWVGMDPRALVELVEGRLELEAALLAGGVTLRAPPLALLGIAEAFRVWVDATMRTPVLQELWKRYRGSVLAYPAPGA